MISLSTSSLSGRAHPTPGSSDAVVATAPGMLLDVGAGSWGCAPNRVRNTKNSCSTLQQGWERFSVPGEPFPPSSRSCLGDFPPQGSSVSFQSPFLLSLGRGCSLSLHSEASLGILGSTKSIAYSLPPFFSIHGKNFWYSWKCLAIAFTLSPQLPLSWIWALGLECSSPLSFQAALLKSRARIQARNPLLLRQKGPSVSSLPASVSVRHCVP